MKEYDVRYDLPGWEIFFSDLECKSDAPGRQTELDELRNVADEVRGRLDLDRLSAHPPVAALRRLFKEAGCDPSRYRPASEALLRRVLKGDEIPAIHPLVDVNNCLSVLLAVPCCVMAEGTFDPPFVFRSGQEGESYESLKGPFRLEGKPLLLDARGPCDAPITGSERVKVREETRRATLVVYLPKGVVGAPDVEATLARLLSKAPVD